MVTLRITDLPGSSRIITYFPKQMSKLKTTCTLLRLISEVPSCWRELEGTGEGMIERLRLLVRKCADDVAVSGHSFTDITRWFPISQDFWEIKRMHKQWITGSLSPYPSTAWVRG